MKPRPPRAMIDTCPQSASLSAAQTARGWFGHRSVARAVTGSAPAARAARAPALRLCWRAYDLDVLGVRWRGVRAAANGRVPCPGWPGRGAVTAVCQPATAAVIAARISSSSTVSVIGTTRCLPPLPWRRLAAVRSKTAPVSRGEAPNAG
jgi:hypothetical protein